jgi:hypothetical protein
MTIMFESARVVGYDNMRKPLHQLYIESDCARRALCRKLFLSGLQRIEVVDFRLHVLRSCLRDCDSHIVTHRALIDEQRSAGVDVRQAEIQLGNLLDVQVTLRIELRKALRELQAQARAIGIDAMIPCVDERTFGRDRS